MFTKVGDTFDGVALVAGKTEEKMYKVGDTFDGVTLVAGKTEGKVKSAVVRQHYSNYW